MNFLQGVQRLSRDCGASGTIATTVGASGESQRFVDWYNEAWMDIQAEHPDWQWLRSSCSFVTVTDQATYTPAECGITDFGAWKPGSFRCYPTAVGTRGEMFLSSVDYEYWRDLYQFGANRDVRNRPTVITVCPNTSVGLGHTPDASGYTVVGDYYKTPSELSGDSAIPALPEKHHMAIVYRAMMIYGTYEAAPEVYQRGEIEYKRMLRRMEIDRLPRLVTAGALA